MEIASKQEDIKRVKALRQWLVSQDIPKHQWGPMLALALGQEVFDSGRGDPNRIWLGLQMATEFIVSYSTLDMLHD